MLATASWAGGLGLLVLVLLPAARRQMEPGAFTAFSGRLLVRIQSLAWLSLTLLAATGMFQLSANINYNGFLAIDSRWALAILVKHVLFGGVLLISAYITWGIGPSIQRQLMVVSRRQTENDQALSALDRLQKRQTLLMKANLVMGAAILALTALARVS